jgi:integrase
MTVTIKIGSGMGQKKKTAKGVVSIINADERIRLRWRYQKNRYSINLFVYNKTNLQKAKEIALRIEMDMINECFDDTLKKYKPGASYNTTTPINNISLVDHFQEWVKNYRHKDCTKDMDYHASLRMMMRWGNFSLEDVVYRLNKETFGARVYNRRLTLLKSFFQWTTKMKYSVRNPLEDITRRKVVKQKRDDRKPFTQAEIIHILNAIRNDTYCPKSARYKHSHYYPFIYFIFKLGVRNAEAVGLRVKHVNTETRIVTICEVLARTIHGTHAAARIRKETKNGKERMLPLDDETIAILQPLIEGKAPDDLVFLSPKRLLIDDRMFQRRVFRKVLEGLNIPVRVLYACRHTFGSRCIHEGLTPVITAFLMGNNPETALRNYTHLMELPKKLPSI